MAVISRDALNLLTSQDGTPLPPCKWRRERTMAGRWACASPKILTPASGVPERQCRACYCLDHPAPPRPRGLCQHLGPRKGAIPCPECGRKLGRAVELPLHVCDLHGVCTIEGQAVGVVCCKDCRDHAPRWALPGCGDVRHLAMHVYPLGEHWRHAVGYIGEHISLFNGLRLVAVAVGPQTESAAAVAELLGPQFCGEILEVPNDGGLREMASYPALMERLHPYRSDKDAQFYCHAKGVTSRKWAPGSERWTDAMLSALVGHWPAVRRELVNFSAVGIFRRLRNMLPESRIPWHYSGTFRWVRSADLYARNWTEYLRNWCGENAGT